MVKEQAFKIALNLLRRLGNADNPSFEDVSYIAHLLDIEANNDYESITLYLEEVKNYVNKLIDTLKDE